MTFNENSNLDSGNVRKRRGGTTAAVGGGGVVVLLLGLLSTQLFGVDLTQFFGGTGTSQQQSASDEDLVCTGVEANEQRDCRVEGAAVTLESYWAQNASAVGISNYVDPTVILYEGQTSSSCGTASNAVGPFYCPPDQSIYMDTSFFDILTQQFGATGGPLSEMYVLAHEWGHHVQNLAGALTADRQRDTGDNGGQVRIELQADCYAGAWMGEAATQKDENGNQIMQEPTRTEIETTISAAESIGDDHIMEQQGMEVQPESFTHGTSEQRVNWLITGYEQGVGACDTFSAPDSQL